MDPSPSDPPGGDSPSSRESSEETSSSSYMTKRARRISQTIVIDLDSDPDTDPSDPGAPSVVKCETGDSKSSRLLAAEAAEDAKIRAALKRQVMEQKVVDGVFQSIEEGQIDALRELFRKHHLSQSVAGSSAVDASEEREELVRLNLLTVKKDRFRSGNWTPLLYACEVTDVSHQMPIVDFLIRQGADVNESTSAECVPLHCAAHKGNFPLFDFLVEHGADVTRQNIKRWTVLHFSVIGGNAQIVSKVLDHPDTNANVKTKGWCWTPLHFACKEGMRQIVEMLVRKGDAKVGLVETGFGNTCLHAAAFHGDHEIVRLLVEAKKANLTRRRRPSRSRRKVETAVVEWLPFQKWVNRPNRKGWTPLHFACRFGNVEVAKVLVEGGNAKIGLQTEKGNTPLHFAALMRNVNLARFLLIRIRRPMDPSAVTPPPDLIGMRNSRGKTAEDLCQDDRALTTIFQMSLPDLLESEKSQRSSDILRDTFLHELQQFLRHESLVDLAVVREDGEVLVRAHRAIVARSEILRQSIVPTSSLVELSGGTGTLPFYTLRIELSRDLVSDEVILSLVRYLYGIPVFGMAAAGAGAAHVPTEASAPILPLTAMNLAAVYYVARRWGLGDLLRSLVVASFPRFLAQDDAEDAVVSLLECLHALTGDETALSLASWRQIKRSAAVFATRYEDRFRRMGVLIRLNEIGREALPRILEHGDFAEYTGAAAAESEVSEGPLPFEIAEAALMSHLRVVMVGLKNGEISGDILLKGLEEVEEVEKPVHAVVVCACSKYFSRLFRRQRGETVEDQGLSNERSVARAEFLEPQSPRTHDPSLGEEDDEPAAVAVRLNLHPFFVRSFVRFAYDPLSKHSLETVLSLAILSKDFELIGGEDYFVDRLRHSTTRRNLVDIVLTHGPLLFKRKRSIKDEIVGILKNCYDESVMGQLIDKVIELKSETMDLRLQEKALEAQLRIAQSRAGGGVSKSEVSESRRLLREKDQELVALRKEHAKQIEALEYEVGRLKHRMKSYEELMS